MGYTLFLFSLSNVRQWAWNLAEQHHGSGDNSYKPVKRVCTIHSNFNGVFLIDSKKTPLFLPVLQFIINFVAK